MPLLFTSLLPPNFLAAAEGMELYVVVVEVVDRVVTIAENVNGANDCLFPEGTGQPLVAKKSRIGLRQGYANFAD